MSVYVPLPPLGWIPDEKLRHEAEERRRQTDELLRQAHESAERAKKTLAFFTPELCEGIRKFLNA